VQVKPSRPVPRRVRSTLVVLAAAAGALGVAVLLLTIAQAGRVLPGTTVAGVPVGGLDEWGARRMLAPALAREERRPIAVSAPGVRVLLRPEDAGLSLDVDASVRAALARGRTGRPTAVLARVTAPLRQVEVAPPGTVDEDRLLTWVDEVARRVEREPSGGDLVIDASTGSVTVEGPRGGTRVDRAASVELLRAALLDLDITRVTLVATTTPPPGSWAALEHLAGRTRVALTGPLVLEHEGKELVVEPEVMAALLRVSAPSDAGGPEPVLHIDARRLDILLGEAARQTFSSTAADARILTEREPPVVLGDLSSTTFVPVPTEVGIVPGTSDVTFVPRLTADQLVTMVMAGTPRAPADLLVVPPALTTEAALAGRPTHLIGTFTTFHPAGTARTVNIRLLADLLDDRVVAPGAEFSINGTSGPRTCDDGFVPAGTIIRGELVDTCGGGVSQFGTTLMNAAFFAGVPLVQWQPHSFFISRYPAGREATLTYPELDVRFTNDTDGFIVVRTSHTPTSITVALYGVPRWASVSAEHGERRAPTTFSEVVRVAPDLRPGARRVVQAGGDGFTISVARARIPATGDDRPVVERWTTVYRPQQRIVEVGVATSPDPTAP
jgi:vancomycin resistance protein YoaR